jgi:hypothetical protein
MAAAARSAARTTADSATAFKWLKLTKKFNNAGTPKLSIIV